MNAFRLSNVAFVAAPVTGEEGQTIKIKLSNKFGMIFWSEHQNTI